MISMEKYLNLIEKYPWLVGDESDPLKIITNKDEIKKWQQERKLDLLTKGDDPERLKIGILFRDPYVTVIRDLVQFPNMSLNGYLRIVNTAFIENGAAGVAILPVQKKKILLMHNFRHATRCWHWEIPRGFGEPKISAETQAIAEIREEIGVNVKELINLGPYYSNTGLEGNLITLFLARIEEEVKINSEIGVDKLMFFSTQELEDFIVKSEITDGFTLAADYATYFL